MDSLARSLAHSCAHSLSLSMSPRMPAYTQLRKLKTCVGRDAHFDLASAAMKLLLGTRLLGLLEECVEVIDEVGIYEALQEMADHHFNEDNRALADEVLDLLDDIKEGGGGGGW